MQGAANNTTINSHTCTQHEGGRKQRRGRGSEATRSPSSYTRCHKNGKPSCRVVTPSGPQQLQANTTCAQPPPPPRREHYATYGHGRMGGGGQIPLAAPAAKIKLRQTSQGANETKAIKSQVAPRRLGTTGASKHDASATPTCDQLCSANSPRFRKFDLEPNCEGTMRHE